MKYRSLAAGLASIVLIGSVLPRQEKPTVVHLRWIHHMDGMAGAQLSNARASNTRLRVTYDSLVKELGEGPLYIDGFGDEFALETDIASHKLDHKSDAAYAAKIDSIYAVDGPLFHEVLEGVRKARPADRNEWIAAWDDAVNRLPEDSLRTYADNREDALIERIVRDKPRVAYVLYGCTHDLTAALARSKSEYRLITVTPQEVTHEPGCDPKRFGPPTARP